MLHLFLVASGAVDGCTPSALNLCTTLNPFAGESGKYEFDGHAGSSPDLTVRIGQTLVFDQRDPSNWMHPLGFAYEPDGAHGADWGGAELPEVEGAGELQYFINGAVPTCAAAGDTGLDCYEPEFFYPRSDWIEKSSGYRVELTVTAAVAAASHGGVLYYFCHIHSKMSGKIRIQNTDGTPYTNAKAEKTLYPLTTRDPVDTICGTTGIADYSGSRCHACSEKFLCGTMDTTVERCLQAINCAMHKEMPRTTPDSANLIAVFMQQMIPHHQNAVNMAKLIMRQVPESTVDSAIDEGGLTNILWDIVNTQNYQIHQFRNYLHAQSPSLLADRGRASSAANCPAGWSLEVADPCFPGDATVVRESGVIVRLDELEAGDKVKAADASGAFYYDEVSRFSYADYTKKLAFVTLATAKSSLRLTAEHRVPVGASCCSTLKKAKDVAVGETVWTATAKAPAPAVVTKVGSASGVGVHNPLLKHGGFPVVDGVVTAFDSVGVVKFASLTVPLVEALCEATGTCAAVHEALALANGLAPRPFIGGAVGGTSGLGLAVATGLAVAALCGGTRRTSKAASL